MSSDITGISAVITFREVGEQMEEYKNISKELQRMLDKAEESDWSYSVYEEPSQNSRTYVEMGKFSPAGEDFSMIIDFDAEDQCSSFRDSLESYYEDFDIDEHIEMWVEAKRSGTSGVPSIRRLVKDAEDIDDMILNLMQTLREMEVEDGNEQ